MITAIEATGLLKPPDLDDLAESFLNDNVTCQLLNGMAVAGLVDPGVAEGTG